MKKIPALICAAFLAASCSLVDPITRPDIALSEQWLEGTPASNAAMPAAEWWRGFGSSRLDALIAEAFEGNPDLRVQGERVIQAELALRVANSSLFPSLDLRNTGTGWSRTDPGSRSGGAVTDRKSTSLNLAASYEIDLWGRVSASIASGKASLTASQYDYEGARLSLAASVATAWFQYLASVERLEIAQENLAIAERVYKVVEARHRNGAVSALDLSRQTTTVLTQRAQIDPLEVQVRQTRMALDILCGRAPSPPSTESQDTLARLAIPVIDAGLPSELLLRRPDIAGAEARLTAASANVGVARAELFPSITLSAGGGLATDALFSLAHPTSTISLSVAILQTIFDGGRRRAQIETARSRERELLETYRKTILSALQEAEVSLSNAARDTRQEEAQAQILVEAERGLRLAELRYSTGADDLLSVLDAQRTRFSVQDQLAQLRLARLTNAVNLFKALGGGWQSPAAN
ncbi:MAG: efflux transporter outer membrane subunit [Azoarcus sp.]|jgi:NodT family efflux transporter outer membrane factor (OMF) lipoprotein|nr:efflux transporter outer membrane subunit [Azoarcus sp.]